MTDHRDELLPGSHECVGCGGLTFRQREDALCPRCAFEAERLIERIELDGLSRDLELMTEFEAYYAQREVQRTRFRKLASPVFARKPLLDSVGRDDQPFRTDPFWTTLRDVS